MTIIVSITIVSCGDNNDEPEAKKVSIVGTWKYDDSDGYWIMSFKGDGTGYSMEEKNSKKNPHTDNFKWEFDENSKNLVLNYYDEITMDYTDLERYSVTSLTESTLKLNYGNDYIIFIRQ
jgi:hypothetical protein